MKSVLAEVFINPGIKNGSLVGDLYATPSVLINIILKNVYSIVGIILIGLLIYGGFTIIMGAGEDPKKVVQGQQLITQALIGFLIVIASYLIVKLIETLTGFPILDFQI
jgi:hypothetical protein